MRIFDCFMYFDEDLLLEIRLETLFNHVDQFIIVEANLDHAGNERKPQFDIKKFTNIKTKLSIYFSRTCLDIIIFTKKIGVQHGEEKIYKEMHFQEVMKALNQMI